MTADPSAMSAGGATPDYGPSKWLVPVDPKKVILRGPLSLPPGLHLMWGGKAIGKTITALAMAHWHVGKCPTSYLYVMEPRSKLIKDLLIGDNWEIQLQAVLNNTSKGVLVVDSLTYLLHRLSVVKQLEESIGKVTYQGGLSPRDIYSCLLLDEMARSADVALIGTFNSDLFPIVDKLEGASEGQMQILAPGHVSLRNRVTRTETPASVPSSFMSSAGKSLGYGADSLTSNLERI